MITVDKGLKCEYMKLKGIKINNLKCKRQEYEEQKCKEQYKVHINKN